MKVNTVAVVGLGLIGGSFALAAKAGGLRVAGVDVCAQTREKASRVLDSVSGDIALIKEADAVFAAVPMEEYEKIFAAAGKHLRADAALFDGASSKRGIIARAKRLLGEKCSRFVPSHPVAGDEKSGFAAARAELFRGRLAVVCAEDSDSDAADTVRGLWKTVGAKVCEMNPREHDRIFSAVSHLPHLLSYALAGLMDGYDGGAKENGGGAKKDSLLNYAAGGFRDFTRIAGSNSALWSEIFLSNSDYLLRAVGDYQKGLEELAALVRAGDSKKLEERLEIARKLRMRYLELEKGGR